MTRIIIGCGNSLRGEDAFGLDVIKALQSVELQKTQLLQALQLTPEIVLELLDADEVVFIDASYCEHHHYALACRLEEYQSNMTHHVSPNIIIAMLNNLYGKYPKFEIFSMLTDAFDTIEDLQAYEKSIKSVFSFYSLVKGLGVK